jgi:hypothetical protein
MRKIITMTLLGILILCSGCIIRSLHQIYTEQDIVFESGLIGQWSEDDSKEVWTFSKKGANGYTLVCTNNKGHQGSFSAHLAKLNGKLFLDLFPEEPELNVGDLLYEFHFLPVHTFLYVKQIEPTLQMSYFDSDWLKKFIANNPKAIRHEEIDGEIILTASTKDLQAFFLKHLNTDGAFDFRDASNMKRRTSVISEEQPNKSAEGAAQKPAP